MCKYCDKEEEETMSLVRKLDYKVRYNGEYYLTIEQAIASQGTSSSQHKDIKLTS